MDHVKLWRLVNTPSGKPAAEPVAAKPQTETEKLLEETLIASPELLIEGLRIIGSQCETQGGPLDLLGLDEDGRLVVFELKRGMLRREAVAQAVDYASFLAELSNDQLSNFIEENSRGPKVQTIESFNTFYSQTFAKAIADIGKPRIILVGVGADPATRRMVTFLAQGGLDISILTFHAFVEDGKTYLAKQVEERTPIAESGTSRNTKAGNQAALSATLRTLGIEEHFEAVANGIREAFGSTCYQWPYPTGYAFSRVEVTTEGQSRRRTLLTLYVDAAHKKEFRIYLQPKAVADAGVTTVRGAATSMGTSATETPAGYVSFWVDAYRPGVAEACRRLASAVSAGATSANDVSVAEEIESRES